ncbi:hypothetical protein L7F22_047937 [Adiantum nelumboides]|nr:hypothetical protein [Adiantum nelumboides]
MQAQAVKREESSGAASALAAATTAQREFQSRVTAEPAVPSKGKTTTTTYANATTAPPIQILRPPMPQQPQPPPQVPILPLPIGAASKNQTPALSCPPAVTYLQSGGFEVYQLYCQAVMASLTWSSLYGSPMSISHQCSTSSSGRSCSNLQALCQQSTVDISEQRSEKVPRRSFAAATLLAVLVESYSAQEAQAARKKPAETTEKKPNDDKSLSAYDAKLLATYRRKEAMKEAMAKQREKAKPAEKPAAGVPKPLAKSASEAATTAEPESPAASVAASATEAVKEAVKSVVPSSE